MGDLSPRHGIQQADSNKITRECLTVTRVLGIVNLFRRNRRNPSPRKRADAPGEQA
jgi:hypothetical protein